MGIYEGQMEVYQDEMGIYHVLVKSIIPYTMVNLQISLLDGCIMAKWA